MRITAGSATSGERIDALHSVVQGIANRGDGTATRGAVSLLHEQTGGTGGGVGKRAMSRLG